MSQIIHIEIGYDCQKLWAALSDEDYAKCRDMFGDKLPEDKANTATMWSNVELFGTIVDLQYLASLGMNPRVKRIRGTFAETLPTVSGEHVDKAFQPAPPCTIYNISVPNAGLFAVQSLAYIEDACTDQIQGLLDKGWRIVAVCPPNDTRRPTYILGHQKSDEVA